MKISDECTHCKLIYKFKMKMVFKTLRFEKSIYLREIHSSFEVQNNYFYNIADISFLGITYNSQATKKNYAEIIIYGSAAVCEEKFKSSYFVLNFVQLQY